jgi:hypothetical protein
VVLVINTGWETEGPVQVDCYPMAMGLWLHTVSKPKKRDEHYWVHDKYCQFVEQECWSQVISDHLAGELFSLLRREGLGKVMIALELLYREYFGE